MIVIYNILFLLYHIFHIIDETFVNLKLSSFFTKDNEGFSGDAA